MKRFLKLLLVAVISISSIWIPIDNCNYAKVQANQWETVYENLLIDSDWYGTYGTDSKTLTFRPSAINYSTGSTGSWTNFTVEKGPHYLVYKSPNVNTELRTVMLGNMGSYDTRLYEHRITNTGYTYEAVVDRKYNFIYDRWEDVWGTVTQRGSIQVDHIKLDTYDPPPHFLNPIYSYWYGYDIYDVITDKQSRIFAAQNNSRIIKIYRANSANYHGTGIKVERRYVAEEPIVETSNNSKAEKNTLIVKGNLINAGVPSVIQHGHIYSTSPSGLTTALSSKTRLGERGSSGEFESIISGLESGQIYYVRAYAEHALGTFYGEVRQVRLNANPEVVIETSNNLILSEENTYILEGQIRDLDNDAIDIIASVGGVEKHLKITGTVNWKNFSFEFPLSEIGQGVQEVKIKADDGNGGITERNLNLEVSARLGNNVYLLVDTLVTDYPQRTYTDDENDQKYQEEYKFSHDSNYYDNSNGLFPKHDQWLLLNNPNELPITRFQQVGKYVLDYRARDNPMTNFISNTTLFNEFYKWSNPAINFVNFYVHRRPIADYIVQLQAAGTGQYQAFVKDYSYDLDNITKQNRGLSQIQWRYKHIDNNIWTTGTVISYTDQPIAIATLPQGEKYNISVRVRDIDGNNGIGEWSNWEEKTILINAPPPVGFTVTPKEGPRGQTFTVTPNPGVGNADYAIRKNSNFQTILTRNNSGAFTTAANLFTTLATSRDYYTIRQSKTVNGVTAEHIETISIFNRIPIVNNLRVTDKGNNNLSLTGSTSSNPIEIDTINPIIRWAYSDADSDTQKSYEVRISNNGSTIASSGFVSGAGLQWQVPPLTDTKTYQATVRAYDGYDWSNAALGYFKVMTNKPPVAGFTINPNPTSRIINTNFISTAYDPDGDVITYQWSYRRAGESWTNFGGNQANVSHMFSDIEYDGQEYMIRQIVTDPYGLSDELIQSVQVRNLAPTAGIVLPSYVIYEGDTILIQDDSSDPEGDIIINHQWEHINPSGINNTFETENVTLRVTEVGTHYIRKRVQDSLGEWSNWTDWIPFEVRELVVEGIIKHTDLWEQHRISYNQSKTNTDYAPRNETTFFPGEKFLIEASTTDIDSSRTDPLSTIYLAANNVSARILTYPFNTNLAGENQNTDWKGELWDASMLTWRSQSVSIRFTARWNNGTVKMIDIPIVIDDDPYWRQHRSK